MERKNLLLLVIIAATTTTAFAQNDFLGLPASSYIDNIADSEAVALGSLPQPTGETSDENRFWSVRKVSAGYSFSHETSGFFEQDSHAVVPELYLESANGLSLNVGAFYAHSSFQQKSFFSRTESDADNFGISLQPAYDALSLWNPENRPQFMEHSKLIAGLGLGYAYQDVETRGQVFFPFFSSIKTETQSDVLLLYPNLVFVQPVSEKFITFLIPAYSMQWSRSKVKDFGFTSYSNYGLFLLTARGDYKIAERFFVSAFATWKRDINRKPDGPKLDSGEFGGQLRFAISERLALRIGYSYETFRRDLETHNCFARLHADF